MFYVIITIISTIVIYDKIHSLELKLNKRDTDMINTSTQTDHQIIYEREILRYFKE